jgi:hypothetical protein
MIYGRGLPTGHKHSVDDAAVSHSAELVRGKWAGTFRRPPHPPLRGTFSPRGEGICEGLTPS